MFSARITKQMKPLPKLPKGVVEADEVPGFYDSDGEDPPEEAQSKPKPPDDSLERVYEMDLDFGSHVLPERPKLPPRQPKGTVKSKEKDKKVPSPANKEYTQPHFRGPLPPVPYEKLSESSESPAVSLPGPTSPIKGPASPIKGPTSPTKGPASPTKGPTVSLKGNTSFKSPKNPSTPGSIPIHPAQVIGGISQQQPKTVDDSNHPILSKQVARVKGVSQQKQAEVAPIQPETRDISKQQTDGIIPTQRSEPPAEVRTKQPPAQAAPLSPSDHQKKITSTAIQQRLSCLRPVNPKPQSNTAEEEVYGDLADVSIQLIVGLFMRKD